MGEPEARRSRWEREGVRGAEEFVCGQRELMRSQGGNIKSCNYGSKQVAALSERINLGG